MFHTSKSTSNLHLEKLPPGRRRPRGPRPRPTAHGRGDRDATGEEGFLSLAPWKSATGRLVGVVARFEDAADVDKRMAEAGRGEGG